MTQLSLTSADDRPADDSVNCDKCEGRPAGTKVDVICLDAVVGGASSPSGVGFPSESS